MQNDLDPKGLLPCPFCGSTDVRLGLAGPYGDGDPQVHCDNVAYRISGPECGLEEEAIAAWNRRHPNGHLKPEGVRKLMRAALEAALGDTP